MRRLGYEKTDDFIRYRQLRKHPRQSRSGLSPIVPWVRLGWNYPPLFFADIAVQFRRLCWELGLQGNVSRIEELCEELF